mmetsp:Transcript_18964/g.44655  ORF Transcript_18964/g.44655 Transcript_18964/m.44655 type:complete len:92 (+) Transcript_18964:114-389(+)
MKLSDLDPVEKCWATNFFFHLINSGALLIAASVVATVGLPPIGLKLGAAEPPLLKSDPPPLPLNNDREGAQGVAPEAVMSASNDDSARVKS